MLCLVRFALADQHLLPKKHPYPSPTWRGSEHCGEAEKAHRAYLDQFRVPGTQKLRFEVTVLIEFVPESFFHLMKRDASQSRVNGGRTRMALPLRY